MAIDSIPFYDQIILHWMDALYLVDSFLCQGKLILVIQPKSGLTRFCGNSLHVCGAVKGHSIALSFILC